MVNVVGHHKITLIRKSIIFQIEINLYTHMQNEITLNIFVSWLLVKNHKLKKQI